MCRASVTEVCLADGQTGISWNRGFEVLLQGPNGVVAQARGEKYFGQLTVAISFDVMIGNRRSEVMFLAYLSDGSV